MKRFIIVNRPQIAEIVEDGSLRKVSEVCDGVRQRVLDLFTRVWGAGPSTAEQWYQKGLRSLKDVEERGNPNRHQKIGLRHFHELDERMQREECAEILEVVRNSALSIQSGLSHYKIDPFPEFPENIRTTMHTK